ncbi:hypothetical protein CJ030_MR5G003634 [Morella rubra]|uniref:Uncharacterized protein n=1 Tax=Morella rubra TaxID=262757 RepID=A0A6A1VN15_9ROSI|nr:hypothetical protein CJ030_MR5G003634 [Morella rubra]
MITEQWLGDSTNKPPSAKNSKFVYIFPTSPACELEMPVPNVHYSLLRLDRKALKNYSKNLREGNGSTSC